MARDVASVPVKRTSSRRLVRKVDCAVKVWIMRPEVPLDGTEMDESSRPKTDGAELLSQPRSPEPDGAVRLSLPHVVKFWHEVAEPGENVSAAHATDALEDAGQIAR
jgi:hypothetical protein